MANGKKAPWFRFFAFDWDSDFVQRSLDNAGAGMYVRLMTLQWIEGGIPADPEMLRNYLHAGREEWDKAWALLEQKFPILLDGIRRNERLEEERRDMEEYLSGKSESGRRGAKSRWQTDGKAIAKPWQADGETIANQQPATSNQQDSDLGATAPPEKPPAVYWDNGIKNAVIDKDWLREELREYSADIGAVLTEVEYGSAAESLRRELLRDPRLRACLLKADGKPSSASKFKAMAAYTVSFFKKELDFKARRQPTNGQYKKRLDAFRDLDREWGDRDQQIAKAIAACKRDHEREAIRGDPHAKEGYRLEWCPDGCGWQRRIELVEQ